jgi:hypothetical protein
MKAARQADSDRLITETTALALFPCKGAGEIEKRDQKLLEKLVLVAVITRHLSG